MKRILVVLLSILMLAPDFAFAQQLDPLPVSGTVTANAGTNLNTSALALESGGNLATVASGVRAEDTTHVSGDKGIMALCVRKTVATDLSAGNTDGDYEPCEVNSNGELMVSSNIVNASLAVTGATAHDGALGATPFPVVTGGQAKATAPTDVSADGDAVVAWFLRNGAQAVQPTFGGVLQSTGNGVAGTGTPRVTIASDNTAFSVNAVQSGTWTVQPGNTANTTPWLTTDSATSATAAAVPAKAAFIGGSDGTNLVGFYLDPCQRGARTRVAINLTAGGQLITGTSSKQTYICDLDLVTATAQNIALVSGTGTVCATGIHAMAGGTTAATGWNFSANGGLTKGIGGFYVYSTTTAADNVCLLLSGTGQVSGSLTYVQY
jgi:hypothetical protein